MIHALWNFRFFILGLVKRDFKSKYMNSLLGSLWAIIQPLAMIIVYTMIFSQVMQAKLPGMESIYAYSIYLCAGLLTWTYFVDTLNRTIGVFLDQSDLIKKVSFPRTALPLTILFSASIDFIIIYGLFFAYLIISGIMPWEILWAVLPLLALQQLIAVCMGVFFGTLNVFFRDVNHFIGVVLQFWFWLTPIVYAKDIVPESFQIIFQINFMAPIIHGYQTIFVYNELPDWSTLYPAMGVGLLFLIASYNVFQKLSDEMVDEL